MERELGLDRRETGLFYPTMPKGKGTKKVYERILFWGAVLVSVCLMASQNRGLLVILNCGI